MGISKKVAAAAMAVVTVASVGAVAWAEDGGSSAGQGSSPPAAAGQPSTAPGRGKAGLLRRVEHGDLIVRTKNAFQPVTIDRGRVTAASATSVTIVRPDAISVTVTIDSNTKFRGVTSAAAIATGKPAVVVSHEGKAITVRQGRRSQP